MHFSLPRLFEGKYNVHIYAAVGIAPIKVLHNNNHVTVMASAADVSVCLCRLKQLLLLFIIYCWLIAQSTAQGQLRALRRRRRTRRTRTRTTTTTTTTTTRQQQQKQTTTTNNNKQQQQDNNNNKQQQQQQD